MQTFSPKPDVKAIALLLDDKRLYKQIVECKQILQVLERRKENPDGKYGFKNHPAVLMWTDSEEFLRYYQLTMLNEWLSRRWHTKLDSSILMTVSQSTPPSWWGNDKVQWSDRIESFPEDDFLVTTPDNVCAITLKTEQMKDIFKRFVNVDESNICMNFPGFEFNDEKSIGKYSTQYLKEIFECFQCVDEQARLSLSKSDFPLEIEGKHFKFTLAPCVRTE